MTPPRVPWLDSVAQLLVVEIGLLGVARPVGSLRARTASARRIVAKVLYATGLLSMPELALGLGLHSHSTVWDMVHARLTDTERAALASLLRRAVSDRRLLPPAARCRLRLVDPCSLDPGTEVSS